MALTHNPFRVECRVPFHAHHGASRQLEYEAGRLLLRPQVALIEAHGLDRT